MKLLFIVIGIIFSVGVSPITAEESASCPRRFRWRKCKSMVDEVSTVLHEACAAVPFASGCTVHRACHELNSSTDSCQPLSSFIAVCLEFPDLAQCESFVSVCGEAKEILSCSGIDDLQLISSEESFKAVQQICETHWMDGCGHCDHEKSYPQNAKQRAAFADDCVNPFGTFAQMCMMMDMIPCEKWKDWCQKSTSKTIPRLCKESEHTMHSDQSKGEESTESSHDESHNHGKHSTDSSHANDHEQTSSSQPKTDNTPNTGTLQSKKNPTLEQCTEDPSLEKCKDFMYPENSVRDDIMKLCADEQNAMPWMSGCSLWNDCRRRHSHSGYCASFTLLATLCEDMPVMHGCETYNKLCTANSKVRQCDQYPAIPFAPQTRKTQTAIIAACSTHSMTQCYQCPSQGAQCPHTLKTMSELCFAMPSMRFCSDHKRFCSSTNNEFEIFCDPGSGNYLPPMRMYFHTGQRDIILFKKWVPESTTGYVFSFFAIVAMGLIVQALKVLRIVLENSWYREIIAHIDNRPMQNTEKHITDDAEIQEDSIYGVRPKSKLMTPQQTLFRNIIRAVMTCEHALLRIPVELMFVISGVSVTVDFALMLIAMTFNVGLFIACVTGLTLGALIFGHLQEKDYIQPRIPLSAQERKPPHTNVEGSCCT